MTVLWVALGGALGAALRYLFGVAALRAFGPGFPWGTFAVNILGAFLMGLAFALMVERAGGLRWAPFVMTGLLGGFTTYSAYALDILVLVEGGKIGLGAAYAFGAMAAALAAVLLGVTIGRAFG